MKSSLLRQVVIVLKLSFNTLSRVNLAQNIAGEEGLMYVKTPEQLTTSGPPTNVEKFCITGEVCVEEGRVAPGQGATESDTRFMEES